MRYTVIGAGAIGGTVGAHLVRGGESVLFVDQDVEHVRVMNQRGLTIRGFDETFTVPVDATTPDALPNDLETVLLAVKAPATEAAVKTFAPRLTTDGCVVSLQNGLNEITIASVVGQAINIAVPTILPPLCSGGAVAAVSRRHNTAMPPSQRPKAVAVNSISGLAKRGKPIQPTISSGKITASSRR